MPTISVVVLTHSRCHLLRQCVENVLQRTSPLTTQIIICDNASTDDTADYLDSLGDSRIEVVTQETNIGVNAYARLFPRCTGDYLVELDDDVIEAPAEWDRALLDAFERLPEIGYLAANLVHNPNDVTSGVMYGVNAHLYRTEVVAGVRLKVGGPVGGWCSLTSRELHDLAGGWSEQEEAFWQEEGVFLERLQEHGYGAAYLEDLQVVHAGGPYYSRTPAEKLAYWRSYNRAVARKNAVKSLLLTIPGVAALNRRRRWFEPPRERPDYVRLYGGDEPAVTRGSSA